MSEQNSHNEDPGFTLINPDEPHLNPEAWEKTKGGTEGIYTGTPKRSFYTQTGSVNAGRYGAYNPDYDAENLVNTTSDGSNPTGSDAFANASNVVSAADSSASGGLGSSDYSTGDGESAAAGNADGPGGPRGPIGPSNAGDAGHNGGKHASHKSSSPYVTKKFLAVCLVFAVIISSALGAGMAMLFSKDSKNEVSTVIGAGDSSSGNSTVQQVYKKNANAVVEITTEVTTETVMGTSVSEGAGSGIIVNKKGYIATNYHVIDGAKKIYVRLRNGKSYRATIVGYDENNDVAVLKIHGNNFTAVTMGDSSKVQVGDLAIAMGNPLGQLGGTTTSGIISALDRKLTINNKTLTLLQTDAAINPGNSGGGLFNSKGQLIGIVVAKGSGTGIEGLGFAIPVNTAKPIIEDIIENGTIAEKPAAGISIYTATEDTLSQFNVDEPGVYIYKVYGNNAKKAGLKSGDRITKLNGKKVTDADKLIAAIQKKKVGDQISLTVERNNKEITVKFKLEKASQFESQTSDSSSQGSN